MSMSKQGVAEGIREGLAGIVEKGFISSEEVEEIIAKVDLAKEYKVDFVGDVNELNKVRLKKNQSPMIYIFRDLFDNDKLRIFSEQVSMKYLPPYLNNVGWKLVVYEKTGSPDEERMYVIKGHEVYSLEDADFPEGLKYYVMFTEEGKYFLYFDTGNIFRAFEKRRLILFKHDKESLLEYLGEEKIKALIPMGYRWDEASILSKLNSYLDKEIKVVED